MSDVPPGDPVATDPPRPTDVILAVDVGAHSFQTGLVTARGVLIDRRSTPIEIDVGPESNYTALAGVVTDLVAQVPHRHHARIVGVGVSSGGLVTRHLDLVTPISVPVVA